MSLLSEPAEDVRGDARDDRIDPHAAGPGDRAVASGPLDPRPVHRSYGIVTDFTPLGAVGGKQSLAPTAIRDLAISLIPAA